jgi:hypothetical protein
VTAALAALQDTGVPITDPDADTTRIEIWTRSTRCRPPARTASTTTATATWTPPIRAATRRRLLEQAPDLICDDGLDNDGDGLADSADPGCLWQLSPDESPACDDGVDNDGDGGTDWDGTPPDPQCADRPYSNNERPAACGLGPELALLALPLARLRRRSRA